MDKKTPMTKVKGKKKKKFNRKTVLLYCIIDGSEAHWNFSGKFIRF